LTVEGQMQNLTNALTIKEVAEILRCSKTHVSNVIGGRVPGTPPLTHLSVGRRKLIRREWLDAWMEANKAKC
jgi:excisionase family DNA binding protein